MVSSRRIDWYYACLRFYVSPFFSRKLAHRVKKSTSSCKHARVKKWTWSYTVHICVHVCTHTHTHMIYTHMLGYPQLKQHVHTTFEHSSKSKFRLIKNRSSWMHCMLPVGRHPAQSGNLWSTHTQKHVHAFTCLFLCSCLGTHTHTQTCTEILLFAGIGLKGNSNALFDGNYISDGSGYGVWVQVHALLLNM